MEATIYNVKLKLTEDMLGTTPKNKEIFAAYIQTKAKELDPELAKEEVENIETVEERGWTTFMKDEKGYFIYDYMILGFLKEAGRAIKQIGLIKQLQSKVSQFVFVFPRKIRLPEIAPEPLERSIRGQTAQGPRTFLGRSDYISAGTDLEFQLHVLGQSGLKKPAIKELLSYGQYKGLGQWRNGSYGRFKVVQLKEIDSQTEA